MEFVVVPAPCTIALKDALPFILNVVTVVVEASEKEYVTILAGTGRLLIVLKIVLLLLIVTRLVVPVTEKLLYVWAEPVKVPLPLPLKTILEVPAFITAPELTKLLLVAVHVPEPMFIVLGLNKLKLGQEMFLSLALKTPPETDN